MKKKIYTSCIWAVTVICIIVGVHRHWSLQDPTYIAMDDILEKDMDIEETVDEEYGDDREYSGDASEEGSRGHHDASVSDDDEDDENIGAGNTGDDDEEDDDEHGLTEDEEDLTDDVWKNADSSGKGDTGKEFHHIVIDIDTTDVKIVEGKQYKVSYRGRKKLKPEVSISSDTLYAKQKGGSNQWFSLGNLTDNNLLTITVPEGTGLNTVKINSDVSDVKLDTVTIDTLTADLDSGDLSIEDCTLEKSNVISDTGDISYEDSSTGTTKIETDTGDIDMEGIHFAELECRSDTGDVEISLAEKLEDYYLDLKTEGGDLKYNGKGRGERLQEGDKDKASRKIIIKTDAGDIDLED